MMISQRLLACIVLIICCSYQMRAQQSTRLAEGWQFLRQDLGNVWEAVRAVPKADAPEAVPKWEKITLPHCVNAYDAVDPDNNYYQGPSWYRNNITIQNPYVKGRTILHFEGAGQETAIYVYTTLVGTHAGGYDEFVVDITDAVDSFRKNPVYQKQFNGKIPVSIRTDNSRNTERIPSSLSDFAIYGGIYRHLNLVYQPQISIQKIFVDPSLDGNSNGSILTRARIYNPDKIAGRQLKFHVSVADTEGELIAEHFITFNSAEQNIPLGMDMIPSAKLWSPDFPYLYTVKVDLLEEDRLIATEKAHTAFRKAAFISKGPFMLNGSRLLLKGTHRHEDHAGEGAAISDQQMLSEMVSIKQMGVNFIRLGHYQQSRMILDLCDSLGILVWEEIPWCRGGLGGNIYQQQGKRMLTNMIEQHYNHPSVIIWGLGNENDWPNDFPSFDTLAIRKYMKELNDLAHILDPDRKTAIRRCDFCNDIPDIYSPTIWAGWYRGIYTDYKSYSVTEMKKVDHFLHVEWGGDSHAGRHAEKPDQLLQNALADANQEIRDSLFKDAARLSKDNNWSETYICNLVDWHLKEQETMPWLTGTAAWTFKDFATPLRPDNPIPYVNQKGVVERNGMKKESYYVFQSYWASKPMAHIYGHSWPVRWGEEGEQKLIKVYSNCDQAELFVNGKSFGVRKRNSQDYPAAGLHWNVPFKKGNYSIKVKAVKGATIVYDSIKLNYQSAKWGKPHHLEIQNLGGSTTGEFVQVTLKDEKGNICLDATDRVRFKVAGVGKLISNYGTTYESSYVEMCNGVAVACVEPGWNKKSVISAEISSIPGSAVFLKF